MHNEAEQCANTAHNIHTASTTHMTVISDQVDNGTPQTLHNYYKQCSFQIGQTGSAHCVNIAHIQLFALNQHNAHTAQILCIYTLHRLYPNYTLQVVYTLHLDTNTEHCTPSLTIHRGGS